MPKTQLDRIELGIAKIHREHGQRIRDLESQAKANEERSKANAGALGWFKLWCMSLTAGLAKLLFLK